MALEEQFHFTVKGTRVAVSLDNKPESEFGQPHVYPYLRIEYSGSNPEGAAEVFNPIVTKAIQELGYTPEAHEEGNSLQVTVSKEEALAENLVLPSTIAPKEIIDKLKPLLIQKAKLARFPGAGEKPNAPVAQPIMPPARPPLQPDVPPEALEVTQDMPEEAPAGRLMTADPSDSGVAFLDTETPEPLRGIEPRKPIAPQQAAAKPHKTEDLIRAAVRDTLNDPEVIKMFEERVMERLRASIAASRQSRTKGPGF